MSYNRTLKEFVRDTRKVVFSSDDALMKKVLKDEWWEVIECTCQSMVCQYVMEVILGSENPKLELVCTDDKCPLWIAELIIKTVCKSLCNVGLYTSSVSKTNLQRNVLYKHLKNITFSSAAIDSHQQLDSSLATSLMSAIEIQTSLETVEIHRMPCGAHFTDTTGEEYFGEEEFTDLFSILASLFKQAQFWSLELALIPLCCLPPYKKYCTHFSQRPLPTASPSSLNQLPLFREAIRCLAQLQYLIPVRLL